MPRSRAEAMQLEFATTLDSLNVVANNDKTLLVSWVENQPVYPDNEGPTAILYATMIDTVTGDIIQKNQNVGDLVLNQFNIIREVILTEDGLALFVINESGLDKTYTINFAE